ncbi:MAG: MBL fold metallo-hydrolase [Actinobacteria bacterium]|nr:MBL fold metallo-hydrolase [Actinomycetota bacterium]
MELIVLGSGGTWPRPAGATSGYLVRHDGFNMWVDAGTGTFSRLQEHIAIEDIHAVLVTHAHPDHFVDLYPCFYARHYGHMGEPSLPLRAPEDFWGRMAGLVSQDGADVAASSFDVRGTAPGEAFELGPFRVRAFEMTHIGVQALGYRIEAGGSVLAYTGDSGPSDEVVKLAEGADLFVCEATWRHKDGLLPFHMSARQAGEHAARAAAGRLVLTHIWPTLDTEDSRSEAAEVFEGPVEIARGGMRMEVGG